MPYFGKAEVLESGCVLGVVLDVGEDKLPERFENAVHLGKSGRPLINVGKIVDGPMRNDGLE